MTTSSKTLIDLETKFWHSMVDQDIAAALQLLHDPACIATAHGAMKFDHVGYQKMAEQGSMIVTSFALSDVEVMFPTDTTAVLTYRVKQSVRARDGGQSITQDMSDTSTWVHLGNRWQCVLHTESPMQTTPEKH